MKSYLMMFALICAIICSFPVLYADNAQAVTLKELCPDKVFDTVTFQGIYTGWQEPEVGSRAWRHHYG
jgi:hypothetical protein